MKKFLVVFSLFIVLFYVGLFSLYKFLNISLNTCWSPGQVFPEILVQEKNLTGQYLLGTDLSRVLPFTSDTLLVSDKDTLKTAREVSQFWQFSNKNTSTYKKEKNILLKKGSEFQFFVIMSGRCFGEEGEMFPLEKKDVLLTMNDQPFESTYPIAQTEFSQEFVVRSSWKNKFKNEWVLKVGWLDDESFEEKKQELIQQKEKQLSLLVTPKNPGPPTHKDFLQYGLSVDFIPEHSLNIFKLDPSFYKAKILYDQNALFLSDWLGEKQNTIIINGGYFNEDFIPSGYLVVDKKRIGEKKFDEDKSALLVIDKGVASIRDLKEKPFTKNETFDFALQSYPFLIRKGNGMVKIDSQKLARRSAIGIDAKKNVYLIIAESPDLSLYQFMNALVSSSIKFEDVMNLDGGPSSGIAINFGEYRKVINSQFPISNILEFTFSK